MRNLLIACLLLMQVSVFSQCAVKGDSPRQHLQELDSFKNEHDTTAFKKDKQLQVTVADMTSSDKKLKNGEAVCLTGYIVKVKWGGGETCNCHSKEQADEDYHIEVAAVPKETDGKKIVVCEMNRYVKTLTIKQVKAMVGHEVQLKGRLFFDEEHKQNAEDTDPEGTDLWRATCWEVHPTYFITVIK